ncbi:MULTISPECIES: 16S rRNA (guanine(527)-N(7))-methyltransferase RsmG [Chromobacterium]|jgi:16S rRNA (guanine527-N7)-methyltransferase|uniref:Ribosomal RNA small subunit methyltransferase G n=2 Tax=Chromobacterium TaxID=535 RepID=A0A2S9X9V7_9NEIS|nr:MULTISPECIES: 16S rRNA (guanine(527)-N(7))-methyltransferase RsmG [Chromobacterium]KIA82210.1 16S rRNA methyltransferase [Chromobacterium piscinae]MDE1714169.1 16S rRNA (guanine(527)-N(7))-methyltransferase RsmG [Chromobacterium amazonense]MDQ4540881.1 16S rRNA (guanine(527)-N(7))-methyltransferase RsmG [Chromobacterium amazonense]POA97522.1 16S rRNA (guanine(527)-N(7))-methyltransferase RsmG [Chromobacterium sinusclupearum]PRP72357.1 16S rRNA methyltransferase G [Chromobacterium amazonense
MTQHIAELKQGLAQLALELTEPQLDLLERYLALLVKWNQTYNLTAIRQEERMVSYHLLDSLSLVPHLQGGSRMLDVGSGGGMPGIPTAIARPDLQVVLLDSNHKKTTFLRQVVLELGLPNVQVMTDRVEAYQPEQKFDRITSRAFSELSEFVKLTRHLMAEGGQYVAMKGVYPYEEIALLPQGVAVSEVLPVTVPGLDAERHLVRMVLQ